MKNTDVLVIGGGPAGLCAAISSAKEGCDVLMLERDNKLGGQLIKQTHMFFGSEKQRASVRGIDIAEELFEEIENLDNLEVLKNATAVGMYEDGIVTATHAGKYFKIKAKTIIVATGANEKFLAFPNNDMPGIYGAGAVQTLMNVHGVKPGKDVLMIGAGNIGLIVSYQLLQAGVNVKAIVDASSNIGGYYVHASKIRRMGVPIYTRHTIKEATGDKRVSKAVIWELNDRYQPIEGSEKELDVDVVCVSVGLSPLTELLWQIGCDMKFVGELGGYVPLRDMNNETSVKGIFVAGDVSGVEEASSAMVEGYISGIKAAERVGKNSPDSKELLADYFNQLEDLRSGPVGVKIREGLSKVEIDWEVGMC